MELEFKYESLLNICIRYAKHERADTIMQTSEIDKQELYICKLLNYMDE